MAILNWRRENMDVPHSPHTVVKLYTDEGLMGIGEGGNEAVLKRMVGHSPGNITSMTPSAGHRPPSMICSAKRRAAGLPADLSQPEEAYHSGILEPQLSARYDRAEAKRAAGRVTASTK